MSVRVGVFVFLSIFMVSKLYIYAWEGGRLHIYVCVRMCVCLSLYVSFIPGFKVIHLCICVRACERVYFTLFLFFIHEFKVTHD